MDLNFNYMEISVRQIRLVLLMGLSHPANFVCRILQLGAQGNRGVGNVHRSSGTRRHTGTELKSSCRHASRAESRVFLFGAPTANLGRNQIRNSSGVHVRERKMGTRQKSYPGGGGNLTGLDFSV
mmetsp:Transcript_26755/g.27111  ORF Transcript_26755/g.27111 Transcript_26755/m.27111 type:complete len:125 (-) Transcript_26755:982-1356(-)